MGADLRSGAPYDDRDDMTLAHPRASSRALALTVSLATAASVLVLLADPSRAAGAGSYTGTIGRAAYEIQMPTAWNGTLLLWNHGIRTTMDPNRSAESAPTGTDGSTAAALLAKGYALAGSAYSSNGFAVREAVADDVALLGEFARRFGKPASTYVWGASLGGLIAATVAEERPDLINGAAPACGVLAGAIPIGDQVLDTVLMVRALFVPTLQVSGFRTDAQALAVFESAKAAVLAQLASPDSQTASAGKVLAIAALQGLPYQTRAYNGRSTASVVSAAAEGVLTQLGAGLLGYRDQITRNGGMAYQNTGVRYLARANAEAVARFEALGLPGSLLRSYAATLDQRVVRITASRAARLRAARLGSPTGRLTRPVVTMHTVYDPFVTAANEAAYARRVALRGSGAQLLQTYVRPPAYGDLTPSGGGAPYGAGHCVFRTSQWLALLDTLQAFVGSGTKPTDDAVSAVWAADGAPGLDPTFRPLVWTGTVR